MSMRGIKMINITICDENNADRNLEEWQCKSYLSRFDSDFSMKVCASDEDVLTDREQIDILILGDISEKVDAIKIKEEFEKQCRDTYIIFVSNDDLLVEMVGPHVAGFLKKPIEYESFCKAIDKILRIKFKNKKEILLRKKEDEEKINVKDVMYVESAKPYIVLHHKNGEKRIVRTSLKKFIEEEGMPFVRAGKKYVVNLGYVREISEYVLLDNNVKINLSRVAKVELSKKLEGYLLKKQS